MEQSAGTNGTAILDAYGTFPVAHPFQNNTQAFVIARNIRLRFKRLMLRSASSRSPLFRSIYIPKEFQSSGRFALATQSRPAPMGSVSGAGRFLIAIAL